MPLSPLPLPEDRKQPLARTIQQRQAGELTMISDKLGSFCHVKPVGWVRSRAGDDNHWTKSDIPAIDSKNRQETDLRSITYKKSQSAGATAATQGPHPALLEFQAEQSRAELKLHTAKASSVESPTTSGQYGAFYHEQAAKAAAAAAAAAGSTVDINAVNKIGAEQILEQQSKLWGSLDVTAKRLGFGISYAAKGTEHARQEANEDRRRWRSVAMVSFSPEGKDTKTEVVVPDSMNRTSCLFPLSPVNKYSAAMVPSSLRNPQAAKAAKPASPTSSATASASASAAPTQPHSPSKPFPSAHGYMQEDYENTTAHSLGYGKRHPFFRHYLSSLPDL